MCAGQSRLPAPQSSACNEIRSRSTVQRISSSMTGVEEFQSMREQSQRYQGQGSQIRELHLPTTQ